MNTKKIQREAAVKKARKRRIIVLVICVVCVAAVVAAAAMLSIDRSGARVFSAFGGQLVRLYEDGSFTAQLAHNIALEGTYTEQRDGNVTIISFTHDGHTFTSQIANDVLTIPLAWQARCAHGHITELPRRR